jgi:Protein of unknown function (DUF2844)
MSALLLALGSTPAWAVLGENSSTIELDSQTLGGQHAMVAKSGFDLHKITLQDGSVVNEFVSPAGTVFGISWQGHSVPNLHQLLGTYFTNLQQGQRTRVVPRRAITIQGDNFVFTSTGHLRSFRGRAYVPGLIPSSLTAEVVQ